MYDYLVVSSCLYGAVEWKNFYFHDATGRCRSQCDHLQPGADSETKHHECLQVSAGGILFLMPDYIHEPDGIEER